MDQDVEMQLAKSKARPKVRGKDARWYSMPTASHARPQALPLARRVEPRRAARFRKWKLQDWRLDNRRYRRAKMAAFFSTVVRTRWISE